LGGALANTIIDKETGEVVANANDESTESLLEKLVDANIASIKTL
jgi:DNA-directed RNA polymerase subunit beta